MQARLRLRDLWHQARRMFAAPQKPGPPAGDTRRPILHSAFQAPARLPSWIKPHPPSSTP
jgi:hypothetical protein